LETNSPEIKELLYNFFGVNSHKHLTHLQHWHLVKYLEGQADKLEEGVKIRKRRLKPCRT